MGTGSRVEGRTREKRASPTKATFCYRRYGAKRAANLLTSQLSSAFPDLVYLARHLHAVAVDHLQIKV